MENIKVDVIIPVYHPGKEFSVLLERLTEQTAVIHRIIAMNTEENYWNKELERDTGIPAIQAIGKSNELPSFLILAGAKFIKIFLPFYRYFCTCNSFYFF